MNRHAHHPLQIDFELLDILALLADDNTGASRKDRDAGVLGRALDQDLTNRSGLQLTAQVLTNPKVVVEHLGVFRALRIPA